MRRTTLLALLAAMAVAGWIALFEREENASDDGQPVFGLEKAEILAVEIERRGEPTVRLTRVDEGFVVAAGEGPESFADSGEVDFLLQNVGSLRFERELEGIREEDFSKFGLAPPGLAIRVFPAGDAPDAQPLTAGFGDESPASGKPLSPSRRTRFSWLRPLPGTTSTKAPGTSGTNGCSRWKLRRRDASGSPPALDRQSKWRGKRAAGPSSVPTGWRRTPTRRRSSQYGCWTPRWRAWRPAPRRNLKNSFGLGAPRLRAELSLAVGPQEEEISRTILFGGESRTPPGVFARVESDPLVFVVGKPLFDALREGAETELANLRSLDLFRFAGFQAVTLLVRGPDGEAVFQRREGEEGREWTMEADASLPLVVDTVAVEDLLYKLNSTKADDLGAEQLPSDGAAWTLAVTEASEDSEARGGLRSERTGDRPSHRLRSRRGAGAPGR